MPPTRKKKLIVFVHGWSATHTNTYGGLPRRIASEARALGFDVTVREVFLGKYISFRDEVRVEDISRALRALGYRYVTIDLDGYRTGSLNEALRLRSVQE